MENQVATKEARATTIKGSGVKPATLEELMAMSTPEPSKTWTPVAHVAVPEAVERLVADRKWSFVDPDNKFDIVVTQDEVKMFGVTKVIIPGVEVDHEFQMAIGFRNSHDKSIALRVSVGVEVMVCYNMIITGDIQVRREHTLNIGPLETFGRAFDLIPDAASRLTRWFGDLRNVRISEAEGVAMLADAVEADALPIVDFMAARDSFLTAYANANPLVAHGGTVWSAYQAVTEQFKKHSLYRTQAYSTKLNALVDNKFGFMLN